MLLQSTTVSPPSQQFPVGPHSSIVIRTYTSLKHPAATTTSCSLSDFHSCGSVLNCQLNRPIKLRLGRQSLSLQIHVKEMETLPPLIPTKFEEFSSKFLSDDDVTSSKRGLFCMAASSSGSIALLGSAQVANASEYVKLDPVYEIGELFELGIQLSYLLLLLGLLGVGTFYVIRQVLVRRELDLSAKELQEQVRSGDAGATELFELGAVMLRRKFYPAAIKYLLQAIEKWDGDDQDLAQVYNALGVSYIREGKVDKGITQLESAVKIQPGYVTAWNNLGDAYEKNKDLNAALKAFEEVLLFDPNNRIARPRRDALKEKVELYKGVPIKSKQR